ncbi:MAG: FecR family protein [Bacteroidota bacterium]|nr:FecR family protein [Bacteroidota bacterium]
MQSKNYPWHLIARGLSGEGSQEELNELSKLLANDILLQQQYDTFLSIWNNDQLTQAPAEMDETEKKQLQRILNKGVAEEYLTAFDNTIKKRHRLKKRINYSILSAAVIVVAGFFIFKKDNKSRHVLASTPQIFSAQKGSRSRTMLPDGSSVWINAGSKIYYEDDFDGATREVRLEGEAFFDVAKNVKKPFIVHASGIDIKVLGTTFNVKSYPEDKTVETTLYRGLVQVFRHEDSEKKAIHLKPNEKLILSKQAANESVNLSEEVKPASSKKPASFTIAYIDSTKKESERFETAWLYSRLEFRGDSFEDLAWKMERWYNVIIVFTDEKAKQLNFNGSFEKETVAQAFVALKAAVPFNYTIKGHEIFVGSYQ